jgi:hypothetical protein
VIRLEVRVFATIWPSNTGHEMPLRLSQCAFARTELRLKLGRGGPIR